MDIVEMVRKVVVWGELDVGVSGVDFTADWFGGNVALFWRCVNVRSKRKRSTYVNPNRPKNDYETKSQTIGTTETLYYGSYKSGDFYRIYDKTEQLKKCPWYQCSTLMDAGRTSSLWSFVADAS